MQGIDAINIMKRAAAVALVVGAVAAATGSTQAFGAPNAIRAFAARDLAAIGFTYGKGRGRVDGIDLELAALARFGGPEDLFRKLKEKLTGQFTVTMTPGELGQVLMIADIRSMQCPTCAMPTVDVLDEIMAKTFAITFVELPSGTNLAFGADIGKLAALAANPKKGGPLSYSGSAFSQEAVPWQIVNSSEFTFGGAVALTTLADSNDPPPLVEARLRSALAASGFRPIGAGGSWHDANLGETAATEAWNNGGKSVGFAVTAGAAGHQARIMIHEVTVHQ